MMKSFGFFIFFSGLLISNLESSIASDSFSAYTHTNTLTSALELKPASLLDSYKTAAVCFMGDRECDPDLGFGKSDDYGIDTTNQCKNEGFTLQNCSSVQEIDSVCPYNPRYGKGCKCRTELISCAGGQVGYGDSCGGKYNSCQCKPSLVSCASNQNGTGNTCGGKYESCSCKPEYQYNSSNCSYPRSVAGSSCGGNSTNCTCPSGVSSGAFGCKTYYSYPCSSTCKEARSNPDCDVASQTCSYGCANTNSCGKCTSCNGNPCTETCSGQTSPCSSSEIQTSSCSLACGSGTRYKCRNKIDTCPNGFSKTACSAKFFADIEQTEAGSNCYKCYAKMYYVKNTAYSKPSIYDESLHNKGIKWTCRLNLYCSYQDMTRKNVPTIWVGYIPVSETFPNIESLPEAPNIDCNTEYDGTYAYKSYEFAIGSNCL